MGPNGYLFNICNTFVILSRIHIHLIKDNIAIEPYFISGLNTVNW